MTYKCPVYALHDQQSQKFTTRLQSNYSDYIVAESGGGEVVSVNSTVFCTRYFYTTAVDKKCVQGLIARGKKGSSGS